MPEYDYDPSFDDGYEPDPEPDYDYDLDDDGDISPYYDDTEFTDIDDDVWG